MRSSSSDRSGYLAREMGSSSEHSVCPRAPKHQRSKGVRIDIKKKNEKPSLVSRGRYQRCLRRTLTLRARPLLPARLASVWNMYRRHCGHLPHQHRCQLPCEALRPGSRKRNAVGTGLKLADSLSRRGEETTDQRSTVPMSAWDALMGDGRVIDSPDVSTT